MSVLHVRFNNKYDKYIFLSFITFSLHYLALNSLICADVPLRNYSLTHSLTHAVCYLSNCAKSALCTYGFHYVIKATQHVLAGLSVMLSVLSYLAISTTLIQPVHWHPSKVCQGCVLGST